MGSPQKLFDAPVVSSIINVNAWSYAPHPDGRRFLVNALTEASEPTVNVITNWHRAAADAR